MSRGILLRPANGTGGLDINNDAEFRVDEKIVEVSEEYRSLVSSGPMGGWIGRRSKLRDNLAGCTPRRIVEGR